MAIYAIIQYFKYQWRAKGRHGTHSPFVYNFIEQVLLNKGPIKREYIVEYPHLELLYENLLSRVAQHFNYKTIINLSNYEGATVLKSIDMLVMSLSGPAQWQGQFDAYFPLMDEQSIIAVTGIHKRPEHTAAWNNLCKKDEVKMSMDIYGVGLLLFRQEFKKKQHFILKY